QAGFGNCNDVAAADGPSQRNSGRRAAVRQADTCKCGITQQAGARTAQWRISHHRHAVLLAPWQHVALYAAVAETVRELVGRAAIAFRNTEQAFHIPDLEIGHAPCADLSR